MIYSDSHVHLVDYSLKQLTEILKQMKEKKVELALSVGVNLDSSEGTIKLAESYSQIKAAVGVHPWFAEKLTEDFKQRFRDLAGSKYVSALGEIGLDYAPPISGEKPPQEEMPDMQFPENMPPLPPTPPSREIQKEVFEFEISVALEKKLPVNIHCMGGAHKDMMKILKEAVGSGLTGIAHGFIGGSAELHDWVDLGFYIALGQTEMAMEKIPSFEDIVREVPLERLVMETDGNPMMTPEGPMAIIPHVQKIASIMGDTAENIGKVSTENLRKILNI